MSDIAIHAAGGGGCFPAGTLINTTTGYVAIEELVVGDRVYAFDISSIEPGSLNFPGKVVVKTITATFKHTFGEVGYKSPLLVITHEKGELKVTGNHYILTPSRTSPGADAGFCRADKLQVGDTLYTEYGEATLITKISKGEKYDFVYNLEVEDVHTYIAGKIRVHNGGGEKGGGGTVAPNSVRTKQVARVLFCPSEGETLGLYDSVNPAKSVYFDGTPIQNADGSYNFTNVIVDQRLGLPTQTVIPGFSQTETEYVAAQAITTSASLIRTVTTASIDAVRLSFEFPQGLQTIDTATGNTSGTSVQFRISTRLAAGVWSTFSTPTVNEMSTGPFQVSYLVPRPATAGTWEFRVERLTADSVSNYLVNALALKTYTEIQNVALTYDDRALVAVTVGADSTNNKIPTTAFDIRGVKVKLPNNYNPTTRVYTGAWSGTWSGTYQWTDNPAWCLYDMLTHDRYGLGTKLDEALIDKFSFYEAAQYCDELVNDGNGTGTYEPRFTFNAQFMVRENAWKALQAVASVFNAKLYMHAGYIRLAQDRPAAATKLITNSNVVNGVFTYSGSPATDRYTACNITYNNPDDNFLPTVITEQDAAGIARYGYQAIDMVAYGATSEGQARRAAKWVVYTALNDTQQVEFIVGPEHADIEPGEVFKVMDADYAQAYQEGRALAVAGSAVTIDKPLTITTGTWTIDLVTPSGSIETRTILNGAGVHTVLNLGGAVTAVAGAAYIITGAVSPRKFRSISMLEESTGQYRVTAVQYNEEKYAAVESGIIVRPPVYWQRPQPNTVSQPTSLTFTPKTATNPDGSVIRSLFVTWLAPADGSAIKYRVSWRFSSGPMQSAVYDNTFISIPAPLSGTYDVQVNALNAANVASPTLSGSYSFDAEQGSGSAIGAPSGLTVLGGGTAWVGSELSCVWTAPSQTEALRIKDYQVEVVNPVDSAVLRTEYVTATRFNYRYASNVSDSGPRRSLKIRVRARDTLNKTGSSIEATFTNAAPAAIAGATATGSFSENWLKWDINSETDLEGYVVWASTSAGFTPSAGNRVFVGKGNSFSHTNITPGVNYYYRIAAFDSFNLNPTDSTGLNLSPEISAAAINPASDNEYRFTGSTFTPNSPAANRVAWSAGTIIKLRGTSAGTTFAISAGSTSTWTSGVTYIYYKEGDSFLSSTSTLATAIASDKMILATYRGGTQIEIGNGRAYQDGSLIIAGTVGAAQLVTGTAVITQGAQIGDTIIAGNKLVTGTITATQIAASTITGAKIAANTITAGNIAAGTITATEISGSTITGGKIAANTITAGNIAAGTITATELAAGSVTAGKIAANAVTATEIAASTITGAKIAASTLTVDKIIGGEITSTYTSTTTGNSTSVSISWPADTTSIIAWVASGESQTVSGGKDSSVVVAPCACGINTGGSTLATGAGFAAYAYSPGSSSGSATVYGTRAVASGYTTYGNLTLVVQVCKR